MNMQPLLPATPDDLVAAQLRLANAKDQDDEAQADLRAAKADATACKKELATALRGWRTVLRQMDAMPANGFFAAQEQDDDLEEGSFPTVDAAETSRASESWSAPGVPPARNPEYDAASDPLADRVRR